MERHSRAERRLEVPAVDIFEEEEGCPSISRKKCTRTIRGCSPSAIHDRASRRKRAEAGTLACSRRSV